MTNSPEISILLLGDAEIGKSTFLASVVKGGSSAFEGYDALPLRDADQPFVFNVRLRKKSYRLEFYDSASPEHWSQLTPDVLILCYDISSRASLLSLQHQWHKEAAKFFLVHRELPLLVLGLKRDLRSEQHPNGIIHPQEGLKVAQDMRSDRYLECSAITGELVREVFEDICETAARCTTSAGGQSEGGCNMI